MLTEGPPIKDKGREMHTILPLIRIQGQYEGADRCFFSVGSNFQRRFRAPYLVDMITYHSVSDGGLMYRR